MPDLGLEVLFKGKNLTRVLGGLGVARKAKIRPAVEKMIEHGRLIAEGKAKYGTFKDAFGEDL